MTADDSGEEEQLHWLRRVFQRRPDPAGPDTLTAGRITTGYRLYWTRTAYAWDATHRALIAERVAAVVVSPDFENNLLERRFRVEGLDDQAHSGASLLALAEVLSALDNLEASSDNT